MLKQYYMHQNQLHYLWDYDRLRLLTGGSEVKMHFKYFVMAVLVFVIQGCASPEKRLAVIKQSHSESLAGVTISSTHVGGKALVIVPPRDAIRGTVVVIGLVGRNSIKNFMTEISESHLLTLA
jgi:hypothetical protein